MRLRGLAVLALSCLALSARADEVGRKIIVGVLPFRTPDRFESMGPLAAAHVRSELTESPRYHLVEVDRLAAVMARIAASHRLDYSADDAIEAGRMVAARYMVFGEVISVELLPPGSLFDCNLSASLRLVHVETGAVLFHKLTTVHGGQPVNCLSQALSELSCELLKSATLAGIVLEVPDPGRVVLDLGARDGVHKGQRLRVQREGGVVLHPVTGKALPRPDLPCGEVVIETVEDETSIAKPVKVKDSEIRTGDRVMLPIATNCSKLGSILRQTGTPLLKIITKGIR